MDISSYPAPVPTDEQRRERLQHDIKTVEAAIELNNRLESDLPSRAARQVGEYALSGGLDDLLFFLQDVAGANARGPGTS